MAHVVNHNKALLNDLDGCKQNRLQGFLPSWQSLQIVAFQVQYLQFCQLSYAARQNEFSGKCTCMGLNTIFGRRQKVFEIQAFTLTICTLFTFFIVEAILLILQKFHHNQHRHVCHTNNLKHRGHTFITNFHSDDDSMGDIALI